MDKLKVAIYCRIAPFADEFTLTYLCGIQKAALLEKAEASNCEVVGLVISVVICTGQVCCKCFRTMKKENSPWY